MTIAAILSGKGDTVSTVAADASILSAVKLMADKKIGAVLAVDAAGDVVGVVSERDVVRGLATDGPGIIEQPVAAIMTSPVITVEPAYTVHQSMELMTNRRIRHLPVVDKGRLVGIVSIGDLVKRRIEDAEHVAEELKTYITMG
jgi:CBS domain-containing protein